MIDFQRKWKRRLYLGGLLAWLLYVFLFPCWVGYDYYTYSPDPLNIRLGDTYSEYKDAPLWNPPSASDPKQQVHIRFPFTLPSHRYHIEIVWFVVLARASLGMFVLGMIVWHWEWFRPTKDPDLALSIATSLGFAMLIAWYCIAGFGSDQKEAMVVLLFWMLAGVGEGICRWRRAVRVHKEADRPIDQSDSPLSKPGWFVLLLFFTFGFPLGIIVGNYIVSSAENLIHGFVYAVYPGRGLTGFVARFYAYDHMTPVRIAITLRAIVTVWLLSVVLLRRSPIYLGFTVGLIGSATVLGIMLAIRGYS